MQPRRGRLRLRGRLQGPGGRRLGEGELRGPATLLAHQHRQVSCASTPPREAAWRAVTALDLPVRPLRDVINVDLAPVFSGKDAEVKVVLAGGGEALTDHPGQQQDLGVRAARPRRTPGRAATPPHCRPGYAVALDIPLQTGRTALPAATAERLRDCPDEARVVVGNDGPHAPKSRVRSPSRNLFQPS